MRALQQLERLGLLRQPLEEVREVASAPHASGELLLRFCNAGALTGNLSIALDLRPDELIGPLCTTAGGRASRLRVLDVREQPAELVIELDARTVHWPVRRVVDLIRVFNRFFRADPDVRAVAVLGEWEEMRQLWCIGKEVLPVLLEQSFFQPTNRSQLASLANRTR